MPDTLQATRGGRASADADSETGEAVEAAPVATRTSGGFKAWLPLLVSIVTMPALAFATTKFILQPRLEHALIAKAGEESSKESAEPAAHGKEGGKGQIKNKVTVPLSKMLVNVSGTLGTRYLMTSITLVGNTPEFKTKIEENKDQLMDLATGALSTKTIADLEKPGARNVIRSELITVLNNALGGAVVQEIYITELAIQ